MIGVAILTHGSLGVELLKTSEMIIGKQDMVDVLSVQNGSSLNELANLLEKIKQKYSDSGLLILTDMFGGSPSNIAMAFLESGKVEVLTGVNLPMMIKVLSARQDVKSLEELAKKAQNTAKESVIIAGELIKK